MDKINIRINDPIIMRSDYWVQNQMGTGYNINWSTVNKATIKQTHPKIKECIGTTFFTATILLPYAPSIHTNADYFDPQIILFVINNYLKAIGLQIVKMDDVIIQQMECFVDYLLPENVSYQSIEKQHREAFNPSFNKKYKLHQYNDSIYIATLSRPKRGIDKFNTLFRIYNKSKELKAKKKYQNGSGLVARFELIHRRHRLENKYDGQFTLAKWIQPRDLIKAFHQVYNNVFLFDGNDFVDPLGVLNNLNT